MRLSPPIHRKGFIGITEVWVVVIFAIMVVVFYVLISLIKAGEKEPIEKASLEFEAENMINVLLKTPLPSQDGKTMPFSDVLALYGEDGIGEEQWKAVQKLMEGYTNSKYSYDCVKIVFPQGEEVTDETIRGFGSCVYPKVDTKSVAMAVVPTFSSPVRVQLSLFRSPKSTKQADKT